MTGWDVRGEGSHNYTIQSRGIEFVVCFYRVHIREHITRVRNNIMTIPIPFMRYCVFVFFFVFCSNRRGFCKLIFHLFPSLVKFSKWSRDLGNRLLTGAAY